MTNQKRKNSLKGYRIFNPVRVVIKMPQGWKAQRLVYNEVMNFLAEKTHHKTDQEALISEVVRDIKEKIRLAGKRHYKDIEVFNEDPFSFVARVAEDAGLCVTDRRNLLNGAADWAHFDSLPTASGLSEFEDEKLLQARKKLAEIKAGAGDPAQLEKLAKLVLEEKKRKAAKRLAAASGWSEFFYDRNQAVEELLEGAKGEVSKTEKEEDRNE